MRYLLTILLAFPTSGEEMRMNMWFSQSNYCEFAIEKFTENPITVSQQTGRTEDLQVRSATCRELADDEIALVPAHMRQKASQKSESWFSFR